MKITSIISEYNPFHNGHKYQIEQAREITGCDGIVTLMSGNYVQRGDFAVFPKEARAEAALKCGIDLVLDNPSVCVLRSAEGYARAAVYTLNSLGCVDYLVFGAEHRSIDDLQKIAEFLANENDEYKKVLSENLSKGISFAAARANAISQILGCEAQEILNYPNNLLAVEYLKELIREKSNIKPVLIQRTGTGHNSNITSGNIASASYIRENVKSISNFVPEDAYTIYNGLSPVSIKSAEKAIISSLILMSKEQLVQTPDISEGLENKIKKALEDSDSLEEIFNNIKSKRYAYSRIRRAIICAYLGITKESADMMPEYIKILDFNETGQKILNFAKKHTMLPLIKNASPILKNERAMKLWKKELELDKLYNIFT